jgi:hypothetical protein
MLPRPFKASHLAGVLLLALISDLEHDHFHAQLGSQRVDQGLCTK